MYANPTRPEPLAAPATRAPRPLVAAALVAALASASLAPPASAQSDGVATQEMAERIRQALVNAVPNEANPAGVTVVVEDGRYVLQGLVEGADHHQDAVDALASIEGLDTSLIEDRIVRQ